jgi:small-conductance mechanosensitive channel
MNISQVNQAIMHGNFTNDELSSIIDAVKYGRARLTRQIKRGLAVGDNVNFNSTKLGRNVTGVITKIAIKYVTVRTATGLWRVPANMLTRIDEPEFA